MKRSQSYTKKGRNLLGNLNKLKYLELTLFSMHCLSIFLTQKYFNKALKFKGIFSNKQLSL